MFAYGWDIFMDWGLLSMVGENKLLRDEIVYSSTVSAPAFGSFRIDFLHHNRKAEHGRSGNLRLLQSRKLFEE